ncbi:MAG: hypothetical protein V1794_07650 [Candidatus Glassbacteria bacterium]
MEFSRNFFSYDAEPIQSLDDFIEVTGNYSRRLLGSQTAVLLEKYFGETPVALTANHHGVSYKSITLQGELIFALPRIGNSAGAEVPVVTVLACGIVPLCNCTFPRGIVLSREIEVPVSLAKKVPSSLKIPLIPEKESHCLVSLAPPVDRQQLNKAKSSVARHFNLGNLLTGEKKVLLDLLNEEYDRQEVLGQTDYSDQAVILNRGIWRRIFGPDLRDEIPEIVYLEMERIVVFLLEKDLRDQGSLLYNVFFDSLLRERVINNLDGKMGCWDRRKLTDLLSGIDEHPLGSEAFRGCGSIFFCFVDSRGRRVPALLVQNDSKPVLVGIAPGRKMSIPFTPQEIGIALKKRELIPSLFSSFTALAFARGIKCIGGFMQVDYLPAMQQGLVRALEGREYGDWAEKIARVPTNNFVTGMNVIMTRYPDGSAKPSGAVELIAAGGLTVKDLDRIKNIKVSDANLSGLLESYAEVVSGEKEVRSNLPAISSCYLEKIRSRLVEKYL